MNRYHVMNLTSDVMSNASVLSVYDDARPIAMNRTPPVEMWEELPFDWFIYTLHGIVIPVLFGLVTAIGVAGNLMVAYVIVTRQRMRTATNLMLLNLAISDLIFVGFVPPVTAYMYATANWPFGDLLCRLMHYVVNVTAYVTVYTLVLVSVVRFLTIVHSTRTAWLCTRRNIVVTIVVLWIGLMAANTPVVAVYGTTQVGQETYECMTSVDEARKVFLSLFICAYVIPLAIIAMLSTSIVRHINKQRPSWTCSQANLRSEAKKRKAGRLLFLVTIMFALLWLPMHLHLLVAFYTESPEYDRRWYEPLRILWHILMYANSAINPFIYHHASNDFRDVFHDVINAACCRPNARSKMAETGPTSGFLMTSRWQVQAAAPRQTATGNDGAVVCAADIIEPIEPRDDCARDIPLTLEAST